METVPIVLFPAPVGPMSATTRSVFLESLQKESSFLTSFVQLVLFVAFPVIAILEMDGEGETM